MVKKYILNFVVTHIISTDEHPGLRTESFAIIKLRGVTTIINWNMYSVLSLNYLGK